MQLVAPPSSPALPGQEGTGAGRRQLEGVSGGPLGTPASFPGEDSRTPQGLTRHSSSWSPVMPGWTQGGCVSPWAEIGTPLS